MLLKQVFLLVVLLVSISVFAIPPEQVHTAFAGKDGVAIMCMSLDFFACSNDFNFFFKGILKHRLRHL